MSHADWERLQELFLQALELPEAERGAFLGLNCGGDMTIRREVEALLAADETSDDLLRRIVAAAAADMQMAEAAKAVGRRIGPYAIEREIGSGGMGTVYLAFRDDDQFRQRVAIKVVNRGMDSEFAVTRFRRERQVLADLQHTNIARLLDGGATADGLPFFAMEYLEGARLTDYCDRKRLGKRARLDLFLQVCAAVQYAHRNLVIHGDLKPGNILVGEDGTPKLLDFGIATLIEAHGEPVEFASALSARYASPEQLRGKTLTTATDIYSLGAILRELLAGQSSGDLDHIVNLAMRTEADERYASADDFARDIRRYLEFRPVLAHQGSVWRQTAKLMRRRWFPLLAGFAVLASLVGGIMAARAKAREAEAARAVAEDRLTQMVSLSNQSLADVSLLMERIPGAMPARKELIGSTLDFLGKLSKNAGTDARLSIALAKAYSRLGMLQGGPDTSNMGDREGALKSYRTALALLQSAPFGPARENDARPVWVELQRKAGMLLTDRADIAASPAPALLEAIAITAKWPASLLAEKGVARSRAGLYQCLSRALHSDFPRARGYAQQYLDALAALVNQYPSDPDLRYDLSTAHIELGFVLWNMGGGDPEAAEPHYRSSMQLREQLVNQYPSDMMYKRSLILVYRHFASLQGGADVLSLDHAGAALVYFKKALAMADSIAADPQDLQWPADYATLLVKYSSLDPASGGPAESLVTLRRAAAVLETQAAIPGNGTRFNSVLSIAHDYMGRRLEAMDKHSEAIAEYRSAASFADATLAASPDDGESLRRSFDAERDITHSLTRLGSYGGALEHATDMVSKAEHIQIEQPQREKWIAQAYLSLAEVHRAFAEWAPARDAAHEAVRHGRPLLTGRTWDPNAGMVRDAQALVAECSARMQVK